jgi:hypothetical protein
MLRHGPGLASSCSIADSFTHQNLYAALGTIPQSLYPHQPRIFSMCRGGVKIRRHLGDLPWPTQI